MADEEAKESGRAALLAAFEEADRLQDQQQQGTSAGGQVEQEADAAGAGKGGRWWGMGWSRWSCMHAGTAAAASCSLCARLCWRWGVGFAGESVVWASTGVGDARVHVLVAVRRAFQVLLTV